MSLDREALGKWMWLHFGDMSDSWEGFSQANRDFYLQAADDLALQFKLPLDSHGPGITRCRCGHPVGEHREGENACRGQSPRGGAIPRMVECGCKKAVAAA